MLPNKSCYRITTWSGGPVASNPQANKPTLRRESEKLLQAARTPRGETSSTTPHTPARRGEGKMQGSTPQETTSSKPSARRTIPPRLRHSTDCTCPPERVTPGMPVGLSGVTLSKRWPPVRGVDCPRVDEASRRGPTTHPRMIIRAATNGHTAGA